LKGEAIPRKDHVALHCQPTDFEVDSSGNRGGLKPDAFRVDEDGISSNWVEFEAGSLAEGLQKVSKLLATLRCVRRSHKCGVMNVGEIQDTGLASGKTLGVIHDPVDQPMPNPGHALIQGLTQEDGELLQALTLLVDFYTFGTDALATSKALFGG
jgi:hypothetical protein